MVPGVKFCVLWVIRAAMLNTSVTSDFFLKLINVVIFEISKKNLLLVQNVHSTNIKIFSLFRANTSKISSFLHKS